MKCSECSFETQSITYFIEHGYEHVAAHHAERAVEKKRVISEFKAVLRELDELTELYINTPDDDEAAPMRKRIDTLSDQALEMVWAHEDIKEVRQLWDMMF